MERSLIANTAIVDYRRVWVLNAVGSLNPLKRVVAVGYESVGEPQGTSLEERDALACAKRCNDFIGAFPIRKEAGVTIGHAAHRNNRFGF